MRVPMLAPTPMRFAVAPVPRCEAFAELTLLPPGDQLTQLFQQYFLMQLTAVAIAGSLFVLLAPGVSLLWKISTLEDDDVGFEDRWVGAICRTAGWLARCEITGERNLATAVLQPAAAVDLDMTLAFAQGAVDECTLLRPSRLLENSGRWRFDQTGDGRSVVEWRIRCSGGIASGDETLVPAGTMLYFSATLSEAAAEADDAARRAATLQGVADTRGLQLSDGSISVLKGSGPYGPEMNLALGATELVQVGTFAARAVAVRN
jgi:hypothetical protein